MNDLKDNLARVIEFLGPLTQSAIPYFLKGYKQPIRQDLLSGKAEAPLYVGKSQKIPQRLFQHFGLTQYIAEIIACHFGRLTAFPKYLSVKNRNRFERLCEVLKVGFYC